LGVLGVFSILVIIVLGVIWYVTALNQKKWLVEAHTQKIRDMESTLHNQYIHYTSQITGMIDKDNAKDNDLLQAKNEIKKEKQTFEN
jgi:hypothetical protein